VTPHGRTTTRARPSGGRCRDRHPHPRTTTYARSHMNGDVGPHGNRDALLETFVAELTVAAYRVALRAGPRGTWVDLELDLWQALAGRVRAWRRKFSGSAATHRLPE